MSRDMELSRKILFYIEEHHNGVLPVEINIPDAEKSKISYHLTILDEAGLIIRLDQGGNGSSLYVKRLTWDGHEFIEAAKNEKIWKKSITMMKSKLVGVSFEILKSVLLSQLSRELNI